MKKVVTIGVSGFASVHFRDMQRQQAYGNLSIVAATVLNQEDEAEKCTWLIEHGCEIFDDYKEMLSRYRQKADICVIPTGIHWHLPMAEAALAAGMDVLLEKPAAPTIQDVRYMQQLEKLYQKRVYIAYQHMYSSKIWDVKSDILAGKIGKVRLLKSFGIWPRSTSYFNRNDWAGRLRKQNQWVLDSPFNNAFAHWLNLMCFISGSSLSQSATPATIQAELYRANSIESPDTACMRITTDAGSTLLLYLSHASAERLDPRLEVYGEEGSIVIQETATDEELTGHSNIIVQVDNSAELRDAMYNVVLNEGESPACFLEQASMQTICANGAHVSSIVNRIPEKHLERVSTVNGQYTEIEDIENVICQAFQQELLFSEMQTAPWAKPGRLVPLAGYSFFTGMTTDRTVVGRDSLSVP